MSEKRKNDIALLCNEHENDSSLTRDEYKNDIVNNEHNRIINKGSRSSISAQSFSSISAKPGDDDNNIATSSTYSTIKGINKGNTKRIFINYCGTFQVFE